MIPQASLTKIKSHVPNKPRVRRPLEDRGESAKRQTENDQVKTGREKTAWERRSRKRRPETAPNHQRGRDNRETQRETARGKRA